MPDKGSLEVDPNNKPQARAVTIDQAGTMIYLQGPNQAAATREQSHARNAAAARIENLPDISHLLRPVDILDQGRLGGFPRLGYSVDHLDGLAVQGALLGQVTVTGPLACTAKQRRQGYYALNCLSHPVI